MLLTIILTGKEVHCHLRNKRGEMHKGEAGTDNPGQFLREFLVEVGRKGWKHDGPIPTALILPLDTASWQGRVSALKRDFSKHIRIVFEDNFAEAYLKGAGKDLDASDYILLSSLNEGTELYFHKAGGGSHVSRVKELNREAGYKKLVDHVVAAFAKEGFMLGNEEEKQLAAEITKRGKGGKYPITKKSGKIEINASIVVSERDYEDMVSGKRSLLNQHLHPKIIQSLPKLKEVVLLGDFFDNKVLQEYLRKDLQLGGRLSSEGISNIPKIIKTASSVGFEGIEQVFEVERKQRERIARLKAKQEAIQARESLLREIRQVCVDPAKVDTYKKAFGAKADSLGVPKEVIFWNIQEVLDAIELEQALGKKMDISVMSAADLGSKRDRPEPIVNKTPPPKPQPEPPKPSPKMVKSDKNSAKPGAGAVKEEETTKPVITPPDEQLAKIFKTDKTYAELGFGARKGQLKNVQGEKFLRFISNEQLKDRDAAKRFERLYKVESEYYDKVSPLLNGAFGKYYLRDIMDGEPLAEYVKANGLRFKSDVDKWSGNELKLILKVWKEVASLDYNFNLQPDNIVVLSKLTWALKRDVDVKLFGFPAEEVTKKQMEDRMHKILMDIFGKKTYQNLRKKFAL